MAEKRRIYEVAKDEGLPSALVLQRLRSAGLEARTASSTVDVAEALFILNPNKYPKPDSAPKRRRPAAVPMPDATAPEPEVVQTPTPTPPPEVAGATPSERRKARAAAARAAANAARADTPEGDVDATEPTLTETTPESAEPTTTAVVEAAADPGPAAPTRPERPVVVDLPTVAAPEPAAIAPEPLAPPLDDVPDHTATGKVASPEDVPPPAEEGAPATSAPRAANADTPPRQGASPVQPDASARPAQGQRPAATNDAKRRPAGGDATPPRPTAPTGGAASGEGGGGARRGGEASRPAPAGPPSPGGAPRPGPGAGRGRRRRVVIDAQASRRPVGAQSRDRKGGRGARHDRETVVAVVPDGPVDVASGSAVKEVADALGVGSTQIIKLMMGMGEMVTITQSLSDEAIELVAVELERQVRIVHAEEAAEVEDVVEDDPADLATRAPVVTVMGHVDHGKTSLLDAIRETQVAAGEAGGITQHIGAYQVRRSDRDLTFLDTPGHEAFTAMRARGAKLTDVVVIVVAADDGVMPQTVEAIDHARAAEVPFLIAINKVDKEDANPDRVRQELTNREVIPREWGGTHEFVEVSAKQGTGLDTLLETILLVADVDVDPKGNPNAPASGTVVESRLDPGRGPVCTMLVQRGTLRIGDVVVVGDTYGRVRAMLDFNGNALTAAGPSVPAEVLGLDGVPGSGEKFRVVENERTARQIASERGLRLRAEELANRRPVSLDDLFSRIREGGLNELNIIVKGDVQGSVGALVDALAKIPQTEVRLRVIHTGVGAITESDVMLASASSAIVLGFNVRPRPEANMLAEREGVDIRTYRVIYRAIEDMRSALIGMLSPDIVESVIGHVEVRTTFRASRVGTIAGCYVTDGVVRRSAQVRLLRDGTVVHEGKIASLRRFDDDTREVQTGFECGILIDGYNDVKDGDQIEVFELREVARAEQAPAGD
ncbi:MAG: translation initiation factor IF-2 [Actinobacteria bacterium]|nr:translation initiation factor IF-2 [Actinomycetota bacterium]